MSAVWVWVSNGMAETGSFAGPKRFVIAAEDENTITLAMTQLRVLRGKPHQVSVSELEEKIRSASDAALAGWVLRDARGAIERRYVR